jgi:anti-sigma factor RsiW
MVTRQPHHEHVGEGRHREQERDQHQDDENRTSPDGPCGDVAAYALGVLDPAQHVRFSWHLAGCEACRRDAADFGAFAPVLRTTLRDDPPDRREHCRITRSILVLAAGVVVAVAAVLSVVESLASHADAGSLTRAAPSGYERFPLVERM